MVIQLSNDSKYCVIRFPSQLAAKEDTPTGLSPEDARIWRHMQRFQLRATLFDLARKTRGPKALVLEKPQDADANPLNAIDLSDFSLLKPYFNCAIELNDIDERPTQASEAISSAIDAAIARKKNAKSEASNTPNPNRTPQTSDAPDRTKPNFLIIGAAKSGTSAISEQLAQHPDVFIPPLKEAHYFDRLFGLTEQEIDAQWSRYLDYFEGAGNFKRRGEATVAYTMIPQVNSVPEQILNKLGKLSLIYIVRDPIERIISQYRHGKLNDSAIAPFNEWIRSERALKACVARSDYERQIAPYRELFGEDNIHICFYEDYKQDYLGELAKMFNFLDLPADKIDHIKNEKSNVISTQSVERPDVSEESVAFIRSYIQENTQRFLSHYGKPAGFWPSMA